MSGRKRGFTLIELLVVIAIIAILAAILFPVFLTAKARSQQAACMQNMKELGLAVYTYLNDNNQTFPMNRYRDPAFSGSGKMDGSRFNWKTSIFPYIRNRTGVWRCPGNGFAKLEDETGRNFPGTIRFPRSYALNGDYFNDLSSGSYECPKRSLSDIPRPTRLLFVIESRFDAPDLHGNDMLDWAAKSYAHVPKPADPTVPWNPNLSWMMVHIGGTSNFLFADCHARTLRVRDTLSPTTMWLPRGANQATYDKISSDLAPECYQD